MCRKDEHLHEHMNTVVSGKRRARSEIWHEIPFGGALQPPQFRSLYVYGLYLYTEASTGALFSKSNPISSSVFF